MRRSDKAFVIAWAAFSVWIWGSRSASAEPLTATPGPSAAAAVKIAGPPTCIDVTAEIDGIQSTGSVKVPVTIDSENPYKDLDALKTLNRNFTAEQVEKSVFGATVDMPSQARLVSEYRCFKTWRRQHDFYRKVVLEHRCALIRHRAVQMLEFDLCNVDTVNVLISEYSRSLYPETREFIIRKLGVAVDKRALALVDEAIKSKNKTLSRAAADGKGYGQSQRCMPQETNSKPYYGYTDVGDVCEGTEESTGLVQRHGADKAGSESGDLRKEEKNSGTKAGGAEGVKFGN